MGTRAHYGLTGPALVALLALLAFAVALAPGSGAPAAQAQTQAQTQRPASVDYRSRTIYFLVTDRFAPRQPYAPYVDPDYPEATNAVNCFEQGCTREDEWRRYWGGDVSGVIQRLDYLQGLGISAVWLTPLMENVRAYEGGTGYGTGYHGYWVQNYDAVNPHFGTWADVKRLSQALHERGMRYIQDITLNHSNPFDSHAGGRLDRIDPVSGLPQVFIRSYADDYDRETQSRYYKHYQDTDECRSLPEGDQEWSPWQLQHCPLATLSGYNQRNPAVAAYLIGAGKKWVENGVDDFRLDAIKYLFPEFVGAFTRAMTDYAQYLDRPYPYFVGEWSNGGVGNNLSLAFASQYDSHLTNLLDFQLSFALNRFVSGAYAAPGQRMSAAQLDALLVQRVQAFGGRDDWQGTFIDNHDQMRTLVRLQKLGIADAAERERRLDLATVLLMTVRGIPIILYGDEQYLAHYEDGHATPPEYVNSDNDDPFNRVGMTRWSEDTPAYRIVRSLAALRKESPAIWKGTYRTVYRDADVLVFERRSGDDSVLVAVNRGAAATVDIPGGLSLPPGDHGGVLGDASAAYGAARLSVRQGGAATLTLGPMGALVVRAP
jgi:glycosidase